VPSQSFPVERISQRLPALRQKIGTRFKAWPLSQDLMKAAGLLPRSLAMAAVRKVRLVRASLLGRKLTIRIERQVIFKLFAVHGHISSGGAGVT